MRINKYIAQTGFASRRKADELILKSRVALNGELVTEPGVDVKPGDEITIDGQVLKLPQSFTYVVMNKPAGYVTTMATHNSEQAVHELLPRYLPRVKPVGRLDKESIGLLLFTDDGDFAHEMMHPSFEHEKEYIVTTEKPISDEALEELATGVQLEEGFTSPAQVKRINKTQFSIVLKQGWKRQIRRMVGAVGNSVGLLERTRIGKLRASDLRLQTGEVRNIKKEDII